MTIICLYMLYKYMFWCIYLKYTKISTFWGGQTFQIWWEKNNWISHPQTPGLINGAVWDNKLYLVPNKPKTISFWIPEAVLLWKTICLGVQSHHEDQGDFEQGSTLNISESNNQLELSTYNNVTSYMVLTNPHMKRWIQYNIMKSEDIYENSENLSKVTPVYGIQGHTVFVPLAGWLAISLILCTWTLYHKCEYIQNLQYFLARHEIKLLKINF